MEKWELIQKLVKELQQDGFEVCKKELANLPNEEIKDQAFNILEEAKNLNGQLTGDVLETFEYPQLRFCHKSCALYCAHCSKRL